MVAFIRRTRPVMFVPVIMAVMLLVFVASRFTPPAIATSGSDPYVVPLVTDTNPDPTIVETTITAQGAVVDIGNSVMASVLTFNGTIPGPEFRLSVGDTVIVHFKNNLGHATGIHWHGIELANAADGTPLTQNMVQPGGTFIYKFKVTRPGVYWYHPHHHSSTNQVFKGLYGSLIVTDPNEAALQASGALPSAAQTRTMVLSDITVCKAPGSNDATTFQPTQPWLDGTEGDLPDQPGPPRMPVAICETSPLDEDGNTLAVPFAAGVVPNTQPGGNSGAVSEGQVVLTNGMNVGGRAGSPSAPGALAAGAHTLDVQAGQGVRLQIVNTATTRFFRLKLTDGAGTMIPLVRVGGQGGLLDEAVVEGGIVSGFDFRYQTGEILLDPGDRADVVFAVPPGASGVMTLWTKDFERVGPSGRFTGLPTVPVAHFNIAGSAGSTYTIGAGTLLRSATGDPQIALPAATATLLAPASFSPAKPGLPGQDIQLTNAGNILGINGVQGAHDPGEPYASAVHVGSTRYAALGETLELTVTNVTGAHHPFHLHGFSIQPMDLTKAASPTYTFPYKEYRDNIDVPGGYTLRFRMKLEDRFLMDGVTLGGGFGRWVFHCHIFFHATFGMLSEFDVVAPDGNERPYINSNETELSGAASDTLTMHGTYSDPDGDPVTLSASIGAIVDDGGGAWTWTGSAAASQLVYVTADDGDQKDQIAFQLKINQPPVVTVANASGNEGSAIPVHGTAVDPEGDPLTHSWSYAPVSGVDAGATCSFASPGSLDTTVTCTDDGNYKITLTVSDGINTPVVKNGTLTVANVAPVVTVTSPLSGAFFIVGTTVTVTASITDAGSNDTFTASTCTFNWDGGGATTVGAPAGSTCSRANLFAAAGVYTVTVTGTDDDGGVGAGTVLIVIFDPDAGFVTGGGQINSPAGAYRPNLSLSGVAHFNVNAKYHKDTIVPTGQTRFRFQAANFDFDTTSYEWLVVSGAKAQYKGSGRVNGSGDYAFLLTLTDGKVSGGGGVDRFRLMVVEKATNTVIYDNAFGSPVDMDVANPQAILHGSLVVHKGKK
jgi:FtsP/CotA-like multicopper oxidase with cupredoxin domain